MNHRAGWFAARGGLDPLGLATIKRYAYQGGRVFKAGAINEKFGRLAAQSGFLHVYGAKTWTDNVMDLLSELDTNGDRKVSADEIQGIKLRLLGFSWGGVSAVLMSRALHLTDEEEESDDGKRISYGWGPSYRLCKSIPVDKLLVIDPVATFRLRFDRSEGPEDNVEEFYNYYQIKGGRTIFYLRDRVIDEDGNIVEAEEYTRRGGWVWPLSRIKGFEYSSSGAQRTVQVNVTIDRAEDYVTLPIISRPGGNVLSREWLLRGDSVNHDSILDYVRLEVAGIMAVVPGIPGGRPDITPEDIELLDEAGE